MVRRAGDSLGVALRDRYWWLPGRRDQKPLPIGAYWWARQQNHGREYEFRVAMPAASAYARTGLASGQESLAPPLTIFSANAPPRTARGLAIAPARTQLLTNSQLTGGGSTPTGWTLAGATGVSAPAGVSARHASAVAYTNSGTAQRSFLQRSVTLGVNNSMVSILVENFVGSLRADQVLAMFGATAVALGPWTYPASPANPSGGDAGIIGVGRLDCQLPVSVGGTATVRAGLGIGANATGSITWSTPFVEAGDFSTSWFGDGTRGLPSDALPVPSGCTRAYLTFADGSTVIATGLTPGGTFNYVTPVLANDKGRVGVSELQTLTFHE